MNNQETIKVIQDYDVNGCGYCHQGGDEVEEAFNMAVSALQTQDSRNFSQRNIQKGGYTMTMTDQSVKAGAGNPKPPLGVAPYQIVTQKRICDLAEAIARHASEGSYKPIEKWAREIIEQCSLIECLKNLDMDEE